MTIMQEKEAADKKAAVQQLFTILFPGYKTMLTPRSIILMHDNGNIIIDENNFEFLQEKLS